MATASIPHTSPLARVEPAGVGLDASRCERLMAVLRDEAARGRVPGGVALLARGGRIALFDSFGVQDPATAQPMRRDSIFRIYSMTKPLVSVAIMMLMERGQLLLSDPVSRFIPAFAGTQVAVEHEGQVSLRAPAQPPTVQDLLRHTAGLSYEFLGTSHVQRAYVQARVGSRERTNAELCDALAGIPLMFEPGRMWEYSRATDVLGRIVEVVSGRTLGDFLKDEILDPLGMVDTSFHVPPAQQHRIAEPFAHDPDGGVPYKVFDPRVVPKLELGGGGLMSTAMDYARFVQMMLNRGELGGVRLLSPTTVDYMTCDHLGTIAVNGTLLPPGHGFGLGFAVRTHAGLAPVPGSVGLYYWGGIAGTTFFVDPAEELFAILMIQAPNQRDYYRPLFRDLVYASLVETRA
ncbi:MAG: class A beta-lactamase-related serine hydrolase [Betaproteobacteria bacterium]|jgi:CubicO group peptidase (beta-lactamase class C family)|nr:class A beta-lactamase-related serine hydrolase [Betaproteobacteria bacterium]